MRGVGGMCTADLGQYRDKSFSWLLENDVGWTVWLLSEFIVKVVSCGGHVYG